MKHDASHGEIPEVDPEIPENAVRIYGQSDAMDDFPVLKAFQQYIDSEQAKARKRMLMLCVFFGLLMTVVIAVFVVLLLNVSSRNQSLNDRLVEYAMKERERAAAPIVVQQPQQQENAAILAITAKMDEMQKAFDESRKQAAEAEARRKAADAAEKTALAAQNELEVKRLNDLLAAQKSELDRLAAEKARQEAEKEKERKHQEDLEAYRRKHYPELYEKKEPPKQQPEKDEHAELMKEIDSILDDGNARTYFDEEDRPKKTERKPVAKPTVKPPPPKEYSIPVDIRGSSGRWRVPNE